MKALVTGGTGFIGGRVVDFLVENGHSVRLFSRKPGLPARLNGKDVSIYQGDLGDPSSVLDAMEGVDVFYHIGETRNTSRSASEKNVRLVERIVTGLRPAGIKRFVFVSSITAAGIPSKIPASEDTEPAVVFEDHYTWYKRTCEKLLQKNSAGVEYSVARPAVVYGPGSRYLGRLIGAVEKLGPVGLPFIGSGGNLAPFIHVKDLARAIYLSGTQPGAAGRVFNLTDGLSHSWFDFFHAVAESLGRKLRIIPLPPLLLRAPAVLFDLFFDIFGVKLSVNNYVKYLSSDVSFDNEKAKRLLEWRPEYTFTQGIGEMVREYKKG